MTEVRIDPVKARRAKLSADLDDTDRRIRFYEEIQLDRDLGLDEAAALKTAVEDAAKLRKQAIEEYKDDPSQILDVGDRAIPDNPLNAPRPK